MNMILMRRKFWNLYHGLRKAGLYFTIPACLLLVWIAWLVSEGISEALFPPRPDNDLSHFRRSRSLDHYLHNIDLLIEPSSVPCTAVEPVPVFVMVASAPARYEHRQAVRSTWGKHLPSYFILGLDGTKNDESLINTYVEAKLHGDMVVYDFKDHYQNLTLKTSLMMKWTLERCPQAKFLYKVDDDVLVNPLILKQVLKERRDAKILGYVHNNSWLHRDEYNKWYLPRWLCSDDAISQYVTGPGYLISGEYIRSILNTARNVPLHNIEDIYFTYNVAKKTLGYELTHDSRISPYRPRPAWWPIKCMYWNYASIHSLRPHEILRTWSYIQDIAKEHLKGKQVCSFYNRFINRFVFLL